MDEEKKRQIRQEVREQFQLGRARLYRVQEESKVRRAIENDKQQILAIFKALGPEEELRLTQSLGRLLMNFSKLASYRGMLEGCDAYQLGIELGRDRARFHLVTYLQRRPRANNDELIRYLDQRNGRLCELKTGKDSPGWAPLRPAWEKKLIRRNIAIIEGESWETAFTELPDDVGPYLSRAKRIAAQARVKNVLFTWPRIIREHRKRRKSE